MHQGQGDVCVSGKSSIRSSTPFTAFSTHLAPFTMFAFPHLHDVHGCQAGHAGQQAQLHPRQPLPPQRLPEARQRPQHARHQPLSVRLFIACLAQSEKVLLSSRLLHRPLLPVPHTHLLLRPAQAPLPVLPTSRPCCLLLLPASPTLSSNPGRSRFHLPPTLPACAGKCKCPLLTLLGEQQLQRPLRKGPDQGRIPAMAEKNKGSHLVQVFWAVQPSGHIVMLKKKSLNYAAHAESEGFVTKELP